MSATKNRLKRLISPTALVSLVGWLPWIRNRIGDAFDARDLLDVVGIGPLTTAGTLAFLSTWGWLLGLIWLGIVVMWPDLKPHLPWWSQRRYGLLGFDGARQTIPFYEDREDPLRPDLKTIMDRSKVIWIATHEATNLRGRQLLKKPIERMIVLDPSGVAVELFASVSTERNADQIRGDIKLSVEDARNNHVPLKILDAPVAAIMIGDPDTDEGWAQIEPYMPWSSARERPSIFILKRDYPKCFGRTLCANDVETPSPS